MCFFTYHIPSRVSTGGHMLFITKAKFFEQKTLCSTADIEAKIKILNNIEKFIDFTSSVPVLSAYKPNEGDTRDAIG